MPREPRVRSISCVQSGVLLFDTTDTVIPIWKSSSLSVGSCEAADEPRSAEPADGSGGTRMGAPL